jgi:Ssp1 endopeptidase immunity protein Rap1a
MNRNLFCAVVIVLAVVQLHALTPDKDISASGKRFVEICSSTEKVPEKWNEIDFLNQGLCQGFMTGFNDGSGVAIAVLSVKNSSLSNLTDLVANLGICIPDGVEKGQLIRLALKYIREHPAEAHEPSSALVFKSEFLAFPCAAPVSTSAPAPKPKQ